MMQRESGSVLIEALIGSAIVAMTLGTMFHAIIDSASRNRMAEEKRFANLIAKSELASVGPIVPVASGVTTGVEMGFPWRIDIEPYFGAMPASSAGQVWQVNVTVGNGHGRPAVSLTTLALGKSQSG